VSTVQLTGARATNLATLYGRALDASSANPVLGDTFAVDTVKRLGADLGATGLRPGDEIAVALRGRQIDTWAREFLAAHSAATVVHLGCGLDSRVSRLAPGPGVRWFDVDFPDVIELRHEVCPDHAGYEMIGSSVADPSWLDRIPADLPTLVIAEGLTPYLRPWDGQELVRRIVRRFPAGQLLFDAVSPGGVRLIRFNRAIRVAGAQVHWGIDGGGEVEAIDPRLRCRTELSIFDVDGFDRLPARYRLAAGLARRLHADRAVGALYRVDFTNPAASGNR
jgi:O-methyltransferase involved in polyketide biosynthesis